MGPGLYFLFHIVDSLYSMIFQWILAVGPTKLFIISEICYNKLLYVQKLN